ncbi:hypothetical protein [Stenotrophomonas sp.]|uniref:hypothetical protein n=1 Tax=Stenotrophomonas sp. TaxID=69392 RepID=UPI00289A08EE|nr:hypothetical protein [Stenotrophomonas sp.]
MDERHLKRLYIALSVPFGLPSLLLGGVGAFIAAMMGVFAFIRVDADSLRLGGGLLLWGLAGLSGLLAWVMLSAFWLRGGFAALRAAWVGWWWLLALGMLATLPMLVLALTYFSELGLTVLNSLFAGPSLLVPAALLFCLRWLVPAPPATQGPDHG